MQPLAACIFAGLLVLLLLLFAWKPTLPGHQACMRKSHFACFGCAVLCSLWVLPVK